MDNEKLEFQNKKQKNTIDHAICLCFQEWHQWLHTLL